MKKYICNKYSNYIAQLYPICSIQINLEKSAKLLNTNPDRYDEMEDKKRLSLTWILFFYDEEDMFKVSCLYLKGRNFRGKFCGFRVVS